jgi:hypothetical protein
MMSLEVREKGAEVLQAVVFAAYVLLKSAQW